MDEEDVSFALLAPVLLAAKGAIILLSLTSNNNKASISSADYIDIFLACFYYIYRYLSKRKCHVLYRVMANSLSLLDKRD